MSHFISGVNLEGSLVFHMTPPQIIKPKMKRFLKSSTLEAFLSRKSGNKIIDHVCQRYSQIEQQNLKAEKEMFISNKCSALKKKFKSSFNTNASGKQPIVSVQNFFNDNTMTLEEKVHKFPMNLKELAAKMPPRLQLQKKYNTSINIKMMSIQEAEMIDRQKEQYRQWLNESNNCTNSPNLNKMTYLFERLAEKRNKLKLRTETSQPTEFSQLQNSHSTSRKDESRLEFLLKQNEQLRSYTRKHKKPYTSLDRLRDRYSNDHEIFR